MTQSSPPVVDSPLLDAGAVEAARPDIRLAAPALDRPQQLLREPERLGDRVVASATAFLTGAECPFRCVYCDLWRYTIPGSTPSGAIAEQVAWTVSELADGSGLPAVHTLKLYNASNFFDERAVPAADDEAILSALGAIERVVVECHPRLVLGQRGRSRAARYAQQLVGLEVAFGLETTASGGLERLGKGAQLDDFERAFAAVRRIGGTVRAFVLYGIPGACEADLAAGQQLQWTVDTARWARDRGATAISVIPVRGGNGAMERLAEQGRWRPPTLDALLRAAEAVMTLERPGFDVFVDCWDLEAFVTPEDSENEARRIAQLRALDRGGHAVLAPGARS